MALHKFSLEHLLTRHQRVHGESTKVWHVQKEEGEAKEGGAKEDDAAAEAAKSAAAAPVASAGPSKKAAAAASTAGSAEEWERWMEASRVGVRRPLGADFQKRRYWALGGRASAWRVYVEDSTSPDSSLWGWYEGALAGPRVLSPIHGLCSSNYLGCSMVLCFTCRSRVMLLSCCKYIILTGMVVSGGGV